MGSGSAGAVGGAAGEREGRLSVSIDLGTTFSGVVSLQDLFCLWFGEDRAREGARDEGREGSSS